jgi:hypothetical protein
LRRQLFATWVLYLRYTWPDQSLSSNLQDEGTTAATLANEAFGELQYLVATFLDPVQTSATTQRALVDQAITALASSIPDHVVHAVRAPRFWTPREPAVAIQRADAVVVDRWGRVGDPDATGTPTPNQGAKRPTIRCRTLDGVLQLAAASSRAASALAVGNLPCAEAVTALLAEALLLDPSQMASATGVTGTRPSSLAVSTWQQPWLPVEIQWQVEVAPLESTLTASSITANFEFGPQFGGRDLVVNGTTATSITNPTYSSCSSRSLLAARSTADIEREVAKQLAAGGPLPELAAVEQWLGDGSSPRPIIAQELSGFNAAMLTFQNQPQVPAVDPGAYTAWNPPSTLVVGGVRDRVARSGVAVWSRQAAPFNPMRTGRLRLTWLRIVDAFGQVRDIYRPNTETNIASSSATSSGEGATIVAARSLVPSSDQPGTLWLTPRSIQPSRLLARWLSMKDDHVEMNSHPDTNPVFGWLMFNHWDETLAVYDEGGNPLGSVLLANASWEDAPGAPSGAPINSHLSSFIASVRAAGSGFLTALHESIHAALKIKNPRDSAQAIGLSLLIGRPLALARASLRFELSGLPAVIQGSGAFVSTNQTVAVPSSLSDLPAFYTSVGYEGGVMSVQLPVHLGDVARAHDGLIGYFCDQGSGTDYGTFHALVLAANSPTSIVEIDANPILLTPQCSGTTSDVRLTLLIDPRSPIHVRMGLTPEKALTIPPNMTAAALERMSVSFLTAPILSEDALLELSPPNEPGYEWRWIERSTTGWTTPSVVDPPLPRDQVPDAAVSLREGWLQLCPRPKPSS